MHKLQTSELCTGRADSTGSIEEPLTPGRTERSSAAAGEQVIILIFSITIPACCLHARTLPCNPSVRILLHLHLTGNLRSEVMTR